MFSKLNYVQKNKLLPAAIILLFTFCWFLSFDQTYEVIKIHNKFNNTTDLEVVSFNPDYSKRKLNALNAILQSYNVNKNRWSNDVWLTVSSLALSKKVDIDFAAKEPGDESDSTSLGVKQSFFFFGNYVQLVKLIDTLEHTPRIGQISDVQIKIQKSKMDHELLSSCRMQITLQGY